MPALNLVGDDGIGGAPQPLHPVDLDGVRTRAADVGAQSIQEVCQIHNVGLSGGVFNDSQPPGLHRGQDDIHGGSHCDHVHIDAGPMQVVFRRDRDHAVVQAVIAAQGRKALQVLVNGPDAEIAPARHGNHRLAAASQQSAEKIIGGPNTTGNIGGNCVCVHWPGINLHGVAVQIFHLGAHAL